VLTNDPDTFIEGLWFIGNGNMDILAALTKKKDEKWQFQYRFRYYKNDEVFFGDDEKRHYSGTYPDDNLAVIKAKIRALIKAIVKEMPKPRPKVDYIILQCQMDDPKMLRKMEKFDWCHVKKMEANQ